MVVVIVVMVVAGVQLELGELVRLSLGGGGGGLLLLVGASKCGRRVATCCRAGRGLLLGRVRARVGRNCCGRGHGGHGHCSGGRRLRILRGQTQDSVELVGAAKQRPNRRLLLRLAQLCLRLGLELLARRAAILERRRELLVGRKLVGVGQQVLLLLLRVKLVRLVVVELLLLELQVLLLLLLLEVVQVVAVA